MATTSILRVPGDYQILANRGGIVIDVVTTATAIQRVANTGTLTVYGNLDVIGNSTYIQTTNTNITDNILLLNAGEENQYVSAGTAGIAISRGSITTITNAATLLYNDGEYWNYDNITTTRGIWELGVGDGVGPAPSALRVNAIRVGQAQNFLNLLGQENPLAVVNVRGTTDYEQQVIDDDDIPNKKYVDDRFFVGNESSRKLQVGGTFVKINDNSVSPADEYYDPTNRVFIALGTSTNVVFNIENQTALIQGLTINDTGISVNAGRGSDNLRLTPHTNTGTVQVTSSLSLANVNTPSALSRYTKVYSTSTIGGGGTGLYFVNTVQQDELVSRKRAIIYGIIF